MKTELKFLKILSIGFTLLLILTLVNCNNDSCDDPNGYEFHYLLSDTDDTLLIPYTGNETLRFLRMTPTDTDTIIYQGMGKDYYVNKVIDTRLDCPETYYYEGYKIVFKNQDSVNTGYKIELKLEMIDEQSLWYYIYFLNRIFSHETAFTLNSTSYGGYLGSVTFENLTFSKVSYLQRKYNGIDEKMYINKYDGIIRFELNELILQLIK